MDATWERRTARALPAHHILSAENAGRKDTRSGNIRGVSLLTRSVTSASLEGGNRSVTSASLEGGNR